jgi:hypothetical protein
MEKDKLLETAKSLKPDPPRSKLDEYAEIVWELRRKRKRVCTIAAFLTEHGLRVGKSTIARWLKTHPLPRAAASPSLSNRSLVSRDPPQAKLWPLEERASRKSGFFDSPLE